MANKLEDIVKEIISKREFKDLSTHELLYLILYMIYEATGDVDGSMPLCNKLLASLFNRMFGVDEDEAMIAIRKKRNLLKMLGRRARGAERVMGFNGIKILFGEEYSDLCYRASIFFVDAIIVAEKIKNIEKEGRCYDPRCVLCHARALREKLIFLSESIITVLSNDYDDDTADEIIRIASELRILPRSIDKDTIIKWLKGELS